MLVTTLRHIGPLKARIDEAALVGYAKRQPTISLEDLAKSSEYINSWLQAVDIVRSEDAAPGDESVQ